MSTKEPTPEDHSIDGKGTTVFRPSSATSFGYLQSGKIKKDLLQLVSSYRDSSRSDEERASFSRAAIIFIAFFLECLSNSLYDNNDCSWKKLTEPKYGRLNLSKAVRKYIAKALAKNREFNLDYKGIQDLFTIRNKVFAHAPETTTVSSNNSRRVTKLRLRKFSDFPESLVEFGPRNADQLLEEANTFLKEYTNLMSRDLPEWWKRIAAIC